MPDEPEAAGLLALLLLTDARRPARTDADGSLVRLPDQDRALWDAAAGRGGPGPGPALPAPRPARALPAAGRDRRGAQRRRPASRTPTGARSSSSTTTCSPSRRPRSSRSTGPSRSAELAGPAAGLAEVDRLDLPAYHLFHATRGDLLDRLGRATRPPRLRPGPALTDNAAEQALLDERVAQPARVG